MQNVLSLFSTGMRSISYVGGSLVIVLAVTVYATSRQPADVAIWALDVFGISFIVLLTILCLVVAFSWARLVTVTVDLREREFWVSLGLQAANGVATLALTYTLLGISLGIGTLADQELNADTVQTLIGALTEHFSMAFMTTVIGLPTSAALRALISLTEIRTRSLTIAASQRPKELNP